MRLYIQLPVKNKKFLNHLDESIPKGIFHWFFGNFNGKRARISVTSTFGHIYRADFSPVCQSWEDVEPLELLEWDDDDDKKRIYREKLRKPDLNIPLVSITFVFVYKILEFKLLALIFRFLVGNRADCCDNNTQMCMVT